MASSNYEYMSGFGNHFSTEAREGALPVGQNNPQKCAHGLYAEQLSGTAFTVPRLHNQRSWLYRTQPAVTHLPLEPADARGLHHKFNVVNPNQLRWKPFPMPGDGEEVDFVQGLSAVAGAGDPSTKGGVAVYVYAANKSMENKSYYSSDGDLLIVPQQGTLDVQTEFGRMMVGPEEICVVQRGMHLTVRVEGPVRGYCCEVFDGHFELPSLGPIGANGLANPRDFQTPVAAFDEPKKVEWTVVNKFLGELFTAKMDHSPFNVVAWHGNYAPFKYDLRKFCTMNAVSFDHPDPSIFTVLTCPTTSPGTAALDFVIFPERWLVQEKTFRPPYYHRNCMSEFMGLITGVYDAKAEGFLPGGASLHSCMTPHGPDAGTYEAASTCELKPAKMTDTMAFMFESSYIFRLTKEAMEFPIEHDYYKCWQGLESSYK